MPTITLLLSAIIAILRKMNALISMRFRQMMYVGGLVLRCNKTLMNCPQKPGDEVCSELFISKKKPNLPCNVHYVCFVYPEVMGQKKYSSGNFNYNMNADSLACFERTKRRADTN